MNLMNKARELRNPYDTNQSRKIQVDVCTGIIKFTCGQTTNCVAEFNTNQL